MTIYQLPAAAPAIVSALSWMDHPGVKCKGQNITGLFFPNKPSSEVARAKAVCNGLDGNPPCMFRDVCLRHAIDEHESFGVWGGTSERDRRRIQRARNQHKDWGIYTLEDVRFPGRVRLRRRAVVMVRKSGALKRAS